MAMTTPDTHTIDQLQAIKESVANTGAKFVVVQNSNVKYIESTGELNYYINKNGLTIARFELWNNIIHYIFVRSVRGGD